MSERESEGEKGSVPNVCCAKREGNLISFPLIFSLSSFSLSLSFYSSVFSLFLYFSHPLYPLGTPSFHDTVLSLSLYSFFLVYSFFFSLLFSHFFSFFTFSKLMDRHYVYETWITRRQVTTFLPLSLTSLSSSLLASLSLPLSRFSFLTFRFYQRVKQR